MEQPDGFVRVMATFQGDYEGLKRFGAYLGTFQERATQLNAIELAHEWYLADVPADEAGRWATAGYLPGEGLPLRASGMTPELAAAGDPDTPEEAIARLADLGVDIRNADLSALDE